MYNKEFKFPSFTDVFFTDMIGSRIVQNVYVRQFCNGYGRICVSRMIALKIKNLESTLEKKLPLQRSSPGKQYGADISKTQTVLHVCNL